MLSKDDRSTMKDENKSKGSKHLTSSSMESLAPTHPISRTRRNCRDIYGLDSRELTAFLRHRVSAPASG